MSDIEELKIMRQQIMQELSKRGNGSKRPKNTNNYKKIIPHVRDGILYKQLAAINNTINTMEQPIFLLEPNFSNINNSDTYRRILYRYRPINLEQDVFIEQMLIFCRAMDNTDNPYLQAFIFKHLMDLVRSNNHNLDDYRRKVLQDMVKEYPNNTYKPHFSWIMPVVECEKCGKRGKWFISNQAGNVFCSMKHHKNQKIKK